MALISVTNWGRSFASRNYSRAYCYMSSSVSSTTSSSVSPVNVVMVVMGNSLMANSGVVVGNSGMMMCLVANRSVSHSTSSTAPSSSLDVVMDSDSDVQTVMLGEGSRLGVLESSVHELRLDLWCAASASALDVPSGRIMDDSVSHANTSSSSGEPCADLDWRENLDVDADSVSV